MGGRSISPKGEEGSESDNLDSVNRAAGKDYFSQRGSRYWLINPNARVPPE